MEKRYTLPVAIAMVVGTVIGSGIFFKAEAVLKGTGGNLGIGILAFIIMGVVIVILIVAMVAPMALSVMM